MEAEMANQEQRTKDRDDDDVPQPSGSMKNWDRSADEETGRARHSDTDPDDPGSGGSRTSGQPNRSGKTPTRKKK